MGIRASISEKPAVATGITVLITVVAIAIVVLEVRSYGGGSLSPVKKLYFTVDDGATYFSEDAHMIPPFMHDGKTAVRAFVYQGNSGKPWVQYLGRYRPAAKARLEAIPPGKSAEDASAFLQALTEGMEVKAPLTGDQGWVDAFSARGGKISEVHPPLGVGAVFDAVYP